MNAGFFDDALRWEEGAILASQLASLHPDVDVEGLADMRERFVAMALGPEPDPESGWMALERQLPHRGSRPAHRSRRMVVTLTAAAMMFGTAGAYATGIAPVRNGVDRVVHGVTRLLGGEDTAPAAVTPPSVSVPPVGSSTLPSQGQEGGDGGGSGVVGDADGDDDSDGSGSDDSDGSGDVEGSGSDDSDGSGSDDSDGSGDADDLGDPDDSGDTDEPDGSSGDSDPEDSDSDSDSD